MTAHTRIRSVLICDDRAGVRRELTRMFRLGSCSRVEPLADGVGLLRAYRASIDQVLIGIHSDNQVGIEAFDMLVERHPTAAPIVIGSIVDVDLLAGLYARGAGGLLIWEI